ncbi:MAG: hypothetical protein WA238_00105, partial [Methylocella sp.]
LQRRHGLAHEGYDDVRRACQQLGDGGLGLVSAVDSKALVNLNVAAAYPSSLRKALRERKIKFRIIDHWHQHGDATHRLLCADAAGPRCPGSAEQRDELASSHPISPILRSNGIVAVQLVV